MTWCSLHYRRWQRTGDPTKLRRAIPNRYDVTPTGDGLLILTRPNRLVNECLYDLADHELIATRHWLVQVTGYVISVSVNADTGRQLITLLHRFILGLSRGDERVVDHINGNVRDDRRQNLRIVSHQLNVAHQAIINHKGSSRFRGVSWNKARQRWYAYQNWQSRMYGLGLHNTEEAAADAVAKFRRERGIPSGY